MNQNQLQPKETPLQLLLSQQQAPHEQQQQQQLSQQQQFQMQQQQQQQYQNQFQQQPLQTQQINIGSKSQQMGMPSQQMNPQTMAIQSQMVMNPQQMMMQNQMMMRGGVGGGFNGQSKKLVIELTPQELERKKRRDEERKKYSRQIPVEDPQNLIISGGYQSTLYSLGECCGSLGQYCCCPNPYIQINNSYKGIYERFGKYVKTVESGLHFVNPCTDSLIPIDCKTQNIDLGMQQAITQDNIMLFIHGVVQFRVIDCRQAHYSILNINHAVKELSICALRSIISQFTYQGLLENRELFNGKMEQFVDEYIHDWGVDVEQIIIKDLNMDPKIQESLASAAKETRLAQAKILNAKADVAAAEEQRKAADQLASKSAMQIRFLSTLEKIASKSKVVFLADF